MDPSRWRQIEGILDRALDVPPSDRESFLRDSCGDEALREEIRSLLRAGDIEAEFLDVPAAQHLDPRALEGDDDDPLEGLRFGPWRVVRTLDRGGMGTVALAERDDGEFEQTVALKLVDHAVRSPEALMYAIRERRVLARFEHPGIARLLDGGIAENGTPWFAMELVHGTPIDSFCDTRCLPVVDRLRLFLDVCDAVQYAHENLVVHRDLKPSNILVTEAGRVKLLDFGVARLLDDSDSTRTLARYMTPRYAAPEQVTGAPATTATDVYALGLILYELLSGTAAQPGGALSPADLQRAVVETDPPPPSVAVTRALHPDPARARAATGPVLARRLAGDLDAIVLKALRKEPERRYGTVAALREDVARHLDDQPVSARKGTAAYRVNRFVRRNRATVSAAALVVVALAGGLVAAASQARVAASERDRARSAEAATAAINRFLVEELLQAPVPGTSGGPERTVRDVLAVASGSVDHAFADQPDLEASVRLTLARTYRTLGDYDSAGRHARAALAAQRQRFGESDRTVLASRALLGEIRADEGHHAEALRELRDVRDDQRRLLGDDDVDTLKTEVSVARAFLLRGDSAAAEESLRETVVSLQTGHPGEWRVLLEAKFRLAEALDDSRKLAEGERIYREVLAEQRERLGPDHPETLLTLSRLGRDLQRQLRFPDAEAAYREVLERRSASLDADHPAIGDALHDLGVLADRVYRYDESQEYFRRALRIYRRSLGPDHPRTVESLRSLGVLARLAGRNEVAEPIYREVLEIRRRTLGPLDPKSIRSLRDLQIVLAARNRLDEARSVAREIRDIYERIAARSDVEPDRLREYAEFLLEVDPGDARDPRRALEVAQRAVDASGRLRYHILDVLAAAYHANGRLDKAIATEREALALPEGSLSWTAEKRLVGFLKESGDRAGAEAFLRENLGRRLRERGNDDPLAGQTLQLLGELLVEDHRFAEAESVFRQALEQFRKSVPDTDWRVGLAKSWLGGCLVDLGRSREARPFLEEGYETLRADGRTQEQTVHAARERLARLD